jgi:hypothetical protein
MANCGGLALNRASSWDKEASGADKVEVTTAANHSSLGDESEVVA